jgi:hypothetical protein
MNLFTASEYRRRQGGQWPMRPNILSHYRKIGVGPVGTALLNSYWIWRTHPSSRQLELALFYDRQLSLKTPHAERST